MPKASAMAVGKARGKEILAKGRGKVRCTLRDHLGRRELCSRRAVCLCTRWCGWRAARRSRPIAMGLFSGPLGRATLAPVSGAWRSEAFRFNEHA